MKFLFNILFLIPLSCSSQISDTCNRAVLINRYAKQLPKEICLPENFIVQEIVDGVDLTNDGVNEVVLKLERQRQVDGDTAWLFIYKRHTSGLYQIFKKYNNVYPLYFKDYGHTYQSKKDELNRLKDKYGGSASFSEVLFNKNVIMIKFHTSARSGLLLHFAYKPELRDWVLVKNEEWHGDRGRIEKMTGGYPAVDQIPLSKFNMLDYLD
jgi:hypothetical protein